MVILQAGASAQGGGSSMMTWLFMGLMIAAVLFMMQRSNKKRMQAENEKREQLKNEMKAGTWVRTASGFYGKLVEVDGEVAVLSNLTGEESMWDLRAIVGAVEPPFAQQPEDDAETAEDLSDPAVELPEEPTVKDNVESSEDNK